MTSRPEPISVSSPLGPPWCAHWLGLTGALMLLATFVSYNGWFGFAAERWPWSFYGCGSDIRTVTVLTAWVLTAVWCLALAWTPARRVRAVGCGVLAGILLTASTEGGDPLLPALSAESLAMLLVLAALGAGLLLVRERRGRVLAGAAGALALWMLARPPAGDGDILLETTLRELGALLGDDAPTAARLFEVSIPTAFFALAALGGLLACFGWTGRRLLLLWFFLLLAGVLLATGTPAFAGDHEGGLQGIGRAVTEAVLSGGLLLWLLATFTVRDFGRLEGCSA